MAIFRPSDQHSALRWVVLGLAAAGIAPFVPFWAPLVIAAWVATMARPLVARAARVTGGRQHAAVALVLALIMVMFVPLGLALASLASGATELGRGLLHSDSAKSALVTIVSGEGGEASGLDALGSPEKWMSLVREHGAEAARILGGLAGAASEALVGLFIFFYAVYVFLIDGPTYYRWLEEHAPIEAAPTRRLVGAFHETGRGLFIGVALTGLAQGVVATIAYLALGVPRALVLGLLTCLTSIIPSVGTALVWVPVAIGLALAGKVVPAIIMGAVGVIVIASVDNILRPIFARFGKLELSTFVLLTSIFGGLALVGTWGFILGPLAVRLAKEALEIARAARKDEKDEKVRQPDAEG